MPAGKLVVLVPKGHSLGDMVRRIHLPTKIGRKQPKLEPSASNGIFDNRVLSRQHAEIYEEDGKVMLKDSGSSNGTFVNHEGPIKSPIQLKDGDLVDFGVDVGDEAGNRVVHHKLTVQVSIPKVQLRNGEIDEALPEMDDVVSIVSQDQSKQQTTKVGVDTIIAILTGEVSKQKEQQKALTTLNSLLQRVKFTTPDGETIESNTNDGGDKQAALQTQLQQSTAQFEQEKSELLQQNQKILASEAALRESTQKLSNEVSSLRISVDTLNNDKQALEAKIAEIEKLKQTLEQSIISLKQDHVNALEAQQQQFNTKSEQMENEYKSAQLRHDDEVQSLLSKISLLEIEARKAQETEAKLKQALQGFEQLITQHEEETSKLRGAVSQLSSDMDHLHQTNTTLQQTYEQTQTQKDELVKQYDSEREQAKKAQQEALKGSLQLKKALEEAQQWAIWSPRSIFIVVAVALLIKWLF